MECEMCGKNTATKRHLVEGTVMNLCANDAKYGTPVDTPAPAVSKAAVEQNLERRAGRLAPRSVFDAESLVMVEDYGARIHKAREAKGLSHEQLGNKVSARVPELKHIEAGKLRPGDDLAKRLQRELNISLFEKIEGPPPVVSGQKKAAAGAGLTIGDLLRDAKAKK